MDETSDIPDDVFVLTQSRSGAVAVAGVSAVFAGCGAWVATLGEQPGQSVWAAAILLVGGAAGTAFGLARALRPGRITVSADGIDIWQVFAARSVAWEEVAAIGHWTGRVGRAGPQRPMGVRIVLLDGAHVDLPGGWSVDMDGLIAILTEAWQGFTAPAQPLTSPLPENGERATESEALEAEAAGSA
jgi:hypothetical protein